MAYVPVMAEKTEALEKILGAATVLPVVTLDDPERAAKLAEALVRGGLPVVEVTLRAENALSCLERIAKDVEGVTVGAGTVLDAEQAEAAEKAGAKFMVSPGSSPRLLDACEDRSIPLLPGAVTASEVMALGERGYRCIKFFPAAHCGGVEWLKSISAPLPDFLFSPSGGLTPEDAREYLALDNVICVGGTWIAPAFSIEYADWDGIEARAKMARGLRAEPEAA